MIPTSIESSSTPGLKSPLVWATFLLGTGLLFLNKESENYAIYAFTIAFTRLLSNNITARNASIIGGWMRLCHEPWIQTVGFFAQAGAACYAMKDSIQTGLRNAPR